MLNSVKSLGYINCTARGPPDLLQSLAIISDKTKGLELIEKTQNHTGNQKKGHICLGDQQSYYLQVFRRI